MITSPTLLIDETKCRANIRRMAEKAARHGLEFKPHFKTHQSADIGKWFREEGVSAITVSSVTMARYFRKNGWKDITIAFPVNILEMEKINLLASEIDLTLLISDKDAIEQLENRLSASVAVYVEIDTGSGRTGFSVSNKQALQKAVESVQATKKLHFKGFYSHPGHSYAARSEEEVLHAYAEVLSQCQELRDIYESSTDDLKICIGDTPCCSVAEDFDSIDEISPGNFVFYDLMQIQIGSCSVDNIAVALACPIVAKYPSRNEMVVHGGAVHLSKESMTVKGNTHFGRPAFFQENNHWMETLPDCYLKSISQEHGILKCTPEIMNKLKMGDLIGILPVHSCLTADLMGGFQTLKGERLNHIRDQHSKEGFVTQI